MPQEAWKLRGVMCVEKAFAVGRESRAARCESCRTNIGRKLQQWSRQRYTQMTFMLQLRTVSERSKFGAEL